jgi:hypothetical protein
MKRIIFICVCVMMLGTAGFDAKADDVLSKIALYFPNRIMDALDIFTVSVGVGPVARAKVYATRAFAFGGGAGAEVMVLKGCNRQYGFCRQAGYDISFAVLNRVSLDRDGQTRLIVPFVIDEEGFPSPNERLYEFYNGARDYWAIGGDLSLGVATSVAIHPIEIADFVTGIFFIDLKDDDMTGEDL